jgi:hypothetical protein
MKKLIIYIFAIATICVSCDDYLSLQPKNVLTSQSIEDVKTMAGKHMRTLETGKFSQYSPFAVRGFYNNEFLWYFEDALDFSGLNSFTKDRIEEKEFRWKNNFNEESVWSGLYASIGDFNLYYYELERLNEETDEVKRVKAEVLFSRAFYYLRLVQFFCPYRTNQYESNIEKYGLPVLKQVDDLVDKFLPERLSQKETFEWILQDLTKLEELNIEPDAWNILYNKRAMYGLMAEFYWWRAASPAKEEGDWGKARDYALLSIDGTSLATGTNGIQAIFNPNAISASSAVQVVTPATANINSYRSFFQDFFNTIVIANNEYALYDAEDYRRDLFINPGTKKIHKYDNADVAKKHITNLWRVAEMYLIIAESYEQEGDDTNAKKYLNDFKRSRINNYTSYAGSDIMDEIIRERKKEFLCEAGYRWRDMKRYGATAQRTTSKGEVLNLLENDYRYSFIIPSITELQVNPNNFQNPGWDEQAGEE